MNFNPTTAHSMSLAADLTYDARIEVASVLDNWGWELVTALNVKETQAFFAIKDDKVLVAFRGTEPTKIKDWLTDLKFRKTQVGKYRVHRGFYEALQHVSRDLETLVRLAFVNDATQLYVVGHSAGASIAALFAFFNVPRLDPQVYLFGCPRIGGVRFSKEYNLTLGNSTWRFTNHRDIVTHVPCFWWNYRHIGRSVYYTSTGEVLHEPGFCRRVKEWFSGDGNTITRLKGSVDDHSDYVKMTAELGFKEKVEAA